MTGIADLLQVQLGTEGSDAWGSDVAPTVKLMGIDECTITPIKQNAQIGEMRGSQAPAFISVFEMEEGSASMGGVATYQDIPYFLDALFGNVADSDSGGYATDANGTITRSYNAPLATPDSDLSSPRTFTIVLGENTNLATDAVGMTGGTLNTLTVSASTGAATRFSADFLGRRVNSDALAALSDRTVDVVMGDHWTVAIDPASDAAGTSPLSNTAFSFELTINANRALVRHLGNLTPDEYRDAKWNADLSLSLELDTDSATYLQALLANQSTNEYVIELAAATGSGASARSLQFDVNAVLLSAPAVFSDNDGVITIDLSFAAQYNAVLGNYLTASNLNNVAALA